LLNFDEELSIIGVVTQLLLLLHQVVFQLMAVCMKTSMAEDVFVSARPTSHQQHLVIAEISPVLARLLV
jgi:hypothetical protein